MAIEIVILPIQEGDFLWLCEITRGKLKTTNHQTSTYDTPCYLFFHVYHSKGFAVLLGTLPFLHLSKPLQILVQNYSVDDGSAAFSGDYR